MNKQISSPSNHLFFSLPLELGTLRLTLKTLNANSEFRREGKPHFSIDIRKIYFRNEVLTVGIKLNGESEEKVFIRVKQNELLVSCTVDTDDTYLSRYAYFALYKFVYLSDYYDFSDFYWPDFFYGSTDKSRFLNVINDRKGMDIILKPKYAFFLKPGQKLIYPIKNVENAPRAIAKLEKENIDLEHDFQIGYCLADTLLKSLHSNHYPFLIPYYGKLNKNKNAIKVFTDFVRGQKNLPILDFTPLQEKINTVCDQMMALALIKESSYYSSEAESKQIAEDNLSRRNNLFELWHQVFSLLQSQPFTHYYFTYGMKNISRVIFKSAFQMCFFSNEVPCICFVLTDKIDYYELELRFKVKNKKFVPNQNNTAFFINSKESPFQFYLLTSLSDYDLVSFFAKKNFKVSILKKHYIEHFKNFVDRLSEVYEVK